MTAVLALLLGAAAAVLATIWGLVYIVHRAVMQMPDTFPTEWMTRRDTTD